MRSFTPLSRAGSRRATYKRLLVWSEPGPPRVVCRHALSDSAITLRYKVYLGVVYSIKLLKLPDKGFDQPLVVVVRRSSCSRAFSRLCLWQDCHCSTFLSTSRYVAVAVSRNQTSSQLPKMGLNINLVYERLQRQRTASAENGKVQQQRSCAAVSPPNDTACCCAASYTTPSSWVW